MFERRWWTGCAAVIGISVISAAMACADDPFDDAGAGEPEVAVDATAEGSQPAAGGEVAIVVPTEERQRRVAPEFCRCVGGSNPVAAARIEAKLSGNLHSTGLDFSETPLEEVVSLLQNEYGIPIQINVPALEATGLDPAEPVTVNLHNISLRSALRLLMERLQLTFVVRDEVLLITTPEEAESQLTTCVYDVSNFLDDTGPELVDALIDTIVSCVQSESWKPNGGEGQIRTPQPGLLVVSQTYSVHDELGSLLQTMRKMRHDRPADASAQQAKPVAEDAQKVVTRSYILQINYQGDAEKKLPSQLREMIVQSLPDVQWEGRLDDRQAVMLAVLPDRIVVRHRPVVQASVEELVKESGVALAMPSPRGGTPRGSGGGFGGGGMGGGGGFFAPATAR